MSRKITQHTAITGDQVDIDNDQVEVIDVSDTTDAASGTNKKITPRELGNAATSEDPALNLFLYYNFY